jgi:hypothetical protein
MRTHTFKRDCGHTVRGKRKAYALARPCLDCCLKAIKATNDADAIKAIEREFELAERAAMAVLDRA